MKLIDFCLGTFLITTMASAHAGVEESLQYIETLLSQGKKVAVILMDMQEGFINPAVKNYGEIIQDQIRLLDNIANKQGVYILDVDYDVNYDPH
ncbi:MAG: hypothetical protein ACR2PX_08410 [Endozoicomonas sp.]|uniref:hypothetical protein n=1 Tax=Endozoicomonas sp. TaxID=1892382 RepID=UPI003D9B88CD